MKLMFSKSSFIAVAAGLVILIQMPAYAQGIQFSTFNLNIVTQLASVPPFFKQITVLVSLATTMAGIHGIYKGGADPRSAAPLKNIALIVIGGLLLGITSFALITERSVFGNSNRTPNIEGNNLTSRIYQFN